MGKKFIAISFAFFFHGHAQFGHLFLVNLELIHQHLLIFDVIYYPSLQLSILIRILFLNS